MNKLWRFLICTGLIFSILIGCTPRAETPTTENISQPVANENQEEEEKEEVPPTHTSEPVESIFPNPIEGKIPVIFSHGGAPCDIGGMVFLSKHPNVDLIGIVLTRGEIHPEIAVEKWPVFLYDVLDSHNTAIALGSDIRMDSNSHEFPEAWRKSADDFWGLDLPDQVTEFDPVVGHELIIELVNNSPEKVTLIAMASMIDIALALQEDPGIIDNISHVVIMGGAFTIRGNLDEGPDETSNEAAEWNMWIDAQAAKYLFNSGVPISIVPLDAIQYHVQSGDIDRINTISDPGVEYVAQMWNQQWSWSNGEGFFIWDTITVTAVTNPENFYWTYDGVDVIAESGDFQGQTIALNNGAVHTRYATGANYDAVIDQLLETFRDETLLSPLSPAVETDTIITELAGTWEGDTGAFTIIFTLETECIINEKCGTFEIPDFDLSGDISFVNIEGNIYEFKATNLSSGKESEALYEYLQILDDGRLKYFTSGQERSSEAILERK